MAGWSMPGGSTHRPLPPCETCLGIPCRDKCLPEAPTHVESHNSIANCVGSPRQVPPISTRQTVSTMPSTTRDKRCWSGNQSEPIGQLLFKSEIEKEDEIDQEDLF